MSRLLLRDGAILAVRDGAGGLALRTIAQDADPAGCCCGIVGLRCGADPAEASSYVYVTAALAALADDDGVIASATGPDGTDECYELVDPDSLPEGVAPTATISTGGPGGELCAAECCGSRPDDEDAAAECLTLSARRCADNPDGSPVYARVSIACATDLEAAGASAFLDGERQLWVLGGGAPDDAPMRCGAPVRVEPGTDPCDPVTCDTAPLSVSDSGATTVDMSDGCPLMVPVPLYTVDCGQGPSPQDQDALCTEMDYQSIHQALGRTFPPSSQGDLVRRVRSFTFFRIVRPTGETDSQGRHLCRLITMSLDRVREVRFLADPIDTETPSAVNQEILCSDRWPGRRTRQVAQGLHSAARSACNQGRPGGTAPGSGGNITITRDRVFCGGFGLSARSSSVRTAPASGGGFAPIESHSASEYVSLGCQTPACLGAVALEPTEPGAAENPLGPLPSSGYIELVSCDDDGMPLEDIDDFFSPPSSGLFIPLSTLARSNGGDLVLACGRAWRAIGGVVDEPPGNARVIRCGEVVDMTCAQAQAQSGVTSPDAWDPAVLD